MENKKMTKREYFGELRAIVEDRPELVAFIDHEIELLSRKSSSSKMTKTQIENVGIMETIKNELDRIGKAVTISELQEQSEELGNFSNQKLSALLKKMVESGDVKKSTDKKKSFFEV